ncbi:hypothetical protein [Runella salmonicolor]|uniref:Uncharacterized protein n=1 Tax=Runella salmonicolor TaxID=2950278 RepID=A0ABT1FRL7_9BACT|nr:hypothetical protein [Runella salmonicolor]MCP1384140.1 hypothetical protein [Runella salmonicolor]
MRYTNTYRLAIVLILFMVGTTTFSKGGENYFYGNPLVLNGKALDYQTFWKGSKGLLALVKGNPNSADATRVPFKIYLKHEGQVVNKGLSSDSRELYEVEVAHVLALARFGDELVIEPALKSDVKAKRVIKLAKIDLMYMILGPLLAKQKGGDGC